LRIRLVPWAPIMSATSDATMPDRALQAPTILNALQEDLSGLNGSVTKAFLALGGALQSIAARSREVTALSQSAAGLTAADDSDRTIATLTEILADTERVEKLAEISQIHMSDILLCLKQSRSPLSHLAELPDSLNAVAMLSRIEGSRLQTAAVDVSGLATDIRDLRKQVLYNVNVIAEQADRLTHLVAASVQHLGTITTQGQEHARNLVDQGRSVIEAMQVQTKSSKVAAAKIDEQYAAIRSATDKIVMSLQAEDMARQRVEHVQQALRQASLAAEAGEPQEKYLGILVLQRSQLLSTRDFLGDSILSIGNNLRSLLPRVESLAGETAALAAETDRDGRSLAAAIEAGLGAVSSVFGRFSASARAVVATVENVVPALKGMTKGARELAEIEVAIKLIAVNAAIKTSQLGEHGLTIGVLASELQKVNAENGEYTRSVLDALQRIDLALKALLGHGISQDSRVLKASAAQEVEAEVNALSATVLNSSHELAVKLSGLQEISRTLRAEIENACDVAKHAGGATAAFDSVLRTLDLNFEQLGGVWSAELEKTVKEEMVDLASTYSMQSQRDVHEKLLGGTEGGKTTPPATTDAGELGDNVELF
jgi:hypothetical protein